MKTWTPLSLYKQGYRMTHHRPTCVG